MSDENTTPEETTAAAKARESKKNSIPAERVKVLTEGLPKYEKASFFIVGHKDGVRLAIPKTSGVSRTYFYANGDYSLIPDHPSIRTWSVEERKEQNRGGIMAEVNFEDNVDDAEVALALLVDVVRKAPAPAPKPKREPKVPKAPKVVATEGETTEATAPADTTEA